MHPNVSVRTAHGLQKQTILLADDACESSSCTSTRARKRTLFRVTRSVTTHSKISSSVIVITSIIRHLFYFYLFPCKHCRMFTCTLSLCLRVFFFSWHFVVLVTAVFLKFMPERKLAPATKLAVFLSIGSHFRLDDGGC
jgi:hypothetical protein